MLAQFISLAKPAVSNRLYPLRLKEGTALPAATWQVIDFRPEVAQDGNAGLSYRKVQVSVFGDDYETAYTAALGIINAFNGITSSSITAAFVENGQDLIDAETGKPMLVIEISIWS